MANDEIKKLRAEIEKRRKAVTNKIQRTKRNTGADVSGTEFDPRRAAGTENRMRSENRMRAYLSELNDFMRRNNQFVAGQNNAPLSRSFYNNVYKRNEAVVESIRKERDARLGSIPGPEGFTPQQYRTALPKAGGATNYGPYRQFDRAPEDFVNQAALEKLNADMVKRMNPEYLSGEISRGRESVIKVAEYIENADLVEDISQLTDDQFDLIWFGTTFASRLFLYYDLEKEREDANYKERNQDKVIESKFAGIGELIDWAKKQKPE